MVFKKFFFDVVFVFIKVSRVDYNFSYLLSCINDWFECDVVVLLLK